MEIFAGIRRIFGHMGPVAVLERWKDEFIGDKVQDYGVVQKCPESGGTAHRELRAFLTNRYGALVLFLECVEMESGKRRTSSYPVQSQARAALAEVLGGDETAFLEHVGLGDGIPEEPRPKGLLARIARRIDPTGEGRKLCDVGVFEELDLPNAAAPKYRWRQQTSGYVTEKKGRVLLVLHIKYRTPGLSGFHAFPIDELGRVRLRKVLAAVDDFEERSEEPTAVRDS